MSGLSNPAVASAAHAAEHAKGGSDALGGLVESAPLSAVKAADETVNDSDVLQNDDDLLFVVGANEKWAFKLFLLIISGTTPDMKLIFALPSGAVGRIYWDTASADPQGWIRLEAEQSVQTSGGEETLNASGVVIVGSTGGTVQFQWAQVVADASDTIIRAGSFITAERLS